MGYLPANPLYSAQQNGENPKRLQDRMHLLCRGVDKPVAELYRQFNEETKDGRQMGAVSALLNDAINSIIEVKFSLDLRRAFVENIKAVIWRNKLAADTLNIAAGEQVLEVEVFLVQLTGQEVPEEVLRQIDKEIPYHILFLLEFEGKYQAWIGYKTLAAAGGKNAFKVNRFYHTEWLVAEDLPLQIVGLDMDAVYENLVRQIARERLQSGQGGESGELAGGCGAREAARTAKKADFGVGKEN